MIFPPKADLLRAEFLNYFFMWPTKLEHPCQFTLNLFAEMIEKAPITFPPERKEAMEKIYEEFLADKKIACAKVLDAIAVFGREVWPYRKAWWEMYEKYGRVREAEYFEKHIPEALHEKYFSCKKEGGGHCLREYRLCGKMETCFTPEEKFLLNEVVIAALEEAKKEVDNLVLGDKRGEYQELFKKWNEEQKKLGAKIDELKKMAAENSKWQAEILDKVKTMEEGWSAVERDITPEEVIKAVDFYRGAIENPEAY